MAEGPSEHPQTNWARGALRRVIFYLLYTLRRVVYASQIRFIASSIRFDGGGCQRGTGPGRHNRRQGYLHGNTTEDEADRHVQRADLCQGAQPALTKRERSNGPRKRAAIRRRVHFG